jgi:hypothetical protein
MLKNSVGHPLNMPLVKINLDLNIKSLYQNLVKRTYIDRQYSCSGYAKVERVAG